MCVWCLMTPPRGHKGSCFHKERMHSDKIFIDKYFLTLIFTAAVPCVRFAGMFLFSVKWPSAGTFNPVEDKEEEGKRLEVSAMFDGKCVCVFLGRVCCASSYSLLCVCA